MDDPTLSAVLDEVAARLDEHGVAWRLGGSASRRVRGFDVDPADVDVVVEAHVADRLSEAFPQLQPAGHPPPPAWRSAWLRRWRHPAGPWVEFVGAAAVVVDGVVESLGVDHGIDVHWQGRTIPVSRPDVWDRLASP